MWANNTHYYLKSDGWKKKSIVYSDKEERPHLYNTPADTHLS